MEGCSQDVVRNKIEEGAWATVRQAVLKAGISNLDYSVGNREPYMFLRRELLVVYSGEYTEQWHGEGWAYKKDWLRHFRRGAYEEATV